MKIVTKIVIFTLALVIVVMPAVACGEPAPTPTPTPTLAPAPKKITLADAPVVLDLSPLLPATFEQVDAASEGLSNKDLGLGPDWSEIEVFLSEEPYQLLLTYLTIVESRIEQAATNAVMKDKQQVQSMVIEGLRVSLAEENIELSNAQISVTYPDIAELAVSGEGSFATLGVSMGYEMLWFKSNKVYVFMESTYLSLEKQPLVPIAREIEHRIGMFSQ